MSRGVICMCLCYANLKK